MGTKSSREGPSKKKGQLGKVIALPGRRAPPPRNEQTEAADAVTADTVERALAQMAGLLVTPTGVAEAQRAQLGIVHVLCGARTTFLLEHSPLRELLHVAAMRGRNDARIRAYARDETPWQAFEDARVLREDTLTAVPVPGQERPLGCLVLLGAKQELSDSALTALASHVGAAWEVARLRDDAARRNKDLQTAVAGLKSLEKNREELLANVSHDLKNPLTTIKAYLTMLGRAKLGDLNERQQGAIVTCDRNADRLLRLINELLLLSRLQSGKMQLDERPFGLKGLTEEVIESLRAQADNGRVSVHLASSPEAFVRGDRERISEAVYNLVDNAIQFSRADSEVQLRIAADAGLAMLSVTDQGVGIAAEDLEHLFDPYNRPRSTEGARSFRGLGLPIVSKIVNLHGGRVDAVSKPDEGSTFTLTLPLFAGPVAASEPATQTPRPGGVLLVEDDADCRDVLQQVLEDEGYRVIATSGAAEAKAVLGHIRPGLVLLDLRLRDEDGRNVLHFIRETESLKDVAVYIVSGASDVATLHGGKGIDRIDGILEKPIHVPKLLDTVAAVVRPSRKNGAA